MEPVHYYADSGEIFRITIHEPQDRGDVPESLVQEIWRLQLFDTRLLTAVSGKNIKVLKVGRHNHDQGPDFKDAQLLIDNELFDCDVEIHLFARDWILHGHYSDPAYNNVKLHVLLYPDNPGRSILLANGDSMEELVLAPRLKRSIRSLLHDFRLRSRSSFPCEATWHLVPLHLRNNLVQKRASERFNRRVSKMRELLQKTNDPETILFSGIMRALGYAKNVEPMEEFASHLSIDLLKNFKKDEIRLAFILGLAGLLPSSDRIRKMERLEAEAFVELHARYESLGLDAIESGPRWVNHRLRPQNRPVNRLIQCSYLFSQEGLFASDSFETIKTCLLAKKPGRELQGLFTFSDLRNLDGLGWRDHLKRRSNIGEKRASTILANVLIPWTFALAEVQGDFALLDILEKSYSLLKDQNDSTTSRYVGRKVKTLDRVSAEGLRELYNNWCSESRCQNCDVGKYLLER